MLVSERSNSDLLGAAFLGRCATPGGTTSPATVASMCDGIAATSGQQRVSVKGQVRLHRKDVRGHNTE